MANIGFIGLGNMGLPMAGNLVKAGHTVRGFDLVAANLEAAKGRGITPTSTLLDATDGADVLITMLPAGPHVLAVTTELTKALKGRKALLIDCSTIDVASARQAHGLAKEAGLASLDAPVSGGVGGAEAASLTFMAGGHEDAFQAAKPLLEAMGKRIVHCGDAGAGQAAKICNNMILGVSMIAVCEGFALAERLGLSKEALFEVASNASGQCWSLTSYCPVPGPVPTSPANRGYQPGFAAALMTKDLMLAQDAARQAGAVTPLGAEAAQLYQLSTAAGYGGKDFSGIIEFLRGKAGEHPSA